MEFGSVVKMTTMGADDVTRHFGGKTPSSGNQVLWFLCIRLSYDKMTSLFWQL